MKRIAIALGCGCFLTALIFAAHLTVMGWFSWKDKPMMPNVFTYLLLPGLHLAGAASMSPPVRLLLAIMLDCVFFGIPVWVVLQIRHLVTRRGS